MYIYESTISYLYPFFQSEAINNFVSQVATLQEELITLAASHAEMSDLLEQQKQEIQMQNQLQNELKKKYKVWLVLSLFVYNNSEIFVQKL